MEIKELTNIEEKGEGNFVANFKVEQKTSYDVSIEDLRAHAENYNEDIAKIDAENAELQKQIALNNERKAAITKSATILNQLLARYPVEEPVTEVENGPQLDQNGNVINQ